MEPAQEDNQLLAQACVFCHEFGFPSGKVSQRTPNKRGARRFCPVEEVVIERLKADACESLERGEKAMHRRCFPCDNEQ
jgi:hypothetical protein